MHRLPEETEGTCPYTYDGLLMGCPRPDLFLGPPPRHNARPEEVIDQRASNIAILANPIAGRGRGLEVARQTADALRLGGQEPRAAITEGPGHAEELARSLVGEHDRIIVVGGDGTLREAAQGLGTRVDEVDLGFIPLGNANVVARELGIPLHVKGAIQVAMTGRITELDTLLVNGAFGLAMVGFGLDARITRLVHGSRGRWPLSTWYRVHGDSLYGIIGALALLQRSPRLRLEVDGVEGECSYAAALVSNLQTYAKGWAITPDADPSDGLLDWVGRSSARVDQEVRALMAAMNRRRLPARCADYGRGKAVKVVGEGPLHWQLDGDPMPPTQEVLVEVGPRLRILSPAGD